MSSQKTIYKYFTSATLTEELDFLMKKHQEGWQLQSLKGCQYGFTACSGLDFVYQADYKVLRYEAEKEYLAELTERGWEYILKTNGWYYFRKKRTPKGKNTLFSNEEAELTMYENVLTSQAKRLALLVVLFALLINSQSQITTSVATTSLGFINALYVLVLIALSLLSLQTVKLNKKVKAFRKALKQKQAS